MNLTPAALRVFADELLERGDVWGEFILLQTGRPAGTAPSPREQELEQTLAQRLRDAVGRNLVSLVFEQGLLSAVELQVGEGPVTELERLSRLTEARGLRSVTLDALSWSNEPPLTELWASLERHARLPALTELTVRVGANLGNPYIDGPPQVGRTEPLYRAYPGLHRLELHGVAHELGEVVLPELTRFAASELQPSCIPSLVSAHWPRLRELDLSFDFTPAEAEPVFGALLAAKMSPALEVVRIKSPWPEFFAAALPRSPLGQGRRVSTS